MSKADLKSFLKGLKKSQLEAQVIDLYDRFKDVKVFYDFSFRPNEDKLKQEAFAKIRKEYFPETRRRAKLRRSVAQKFIRHYLSLEVDRTVILEIMLFHIRMGFDFQTHYTIRPDSYFKAFVIAFEQAVKLADQSGNLLHFHAEFVQICERAWRQNWPNAERFESVLGMSGKVEGLDLG